MRCVTVNKAWKASLTNSFIDYQARTFAEFDIEDAAESKSKSTSNTDALRRDLFKLMTSAPALREKVMDLVHVAITITLISSREVHCQRRAAHRP